MYEAGQSGSLPELRDLMRRLEIALARHEQDLREARGLHDLAAVELLRGGALLLAEEIERLRDLLICEGGSAAGRPAS